MRMGGPGYPIWSTVHCFQYTPANGGNPQDALDRVFPIRTWNLRADVLGQMEVKTPWKSRRLSHFETRWERICRVIKEFLYGVSIHRFLSRVVRVTDQFDAAPSS